jgi:hypothetical protein
VTRVITAKIEGCTNEVPLASYVVKPPIHPDRPAIEDIAGPVQKEDRPVSPQSCRRSGVVHRYSKKSMLFRRLFWASLYATIYFFGVNKYLECECGSQPSHIITCASDRALCTEIVRKHSTILRRVSPSTVWIRRRPKAVMWAGFNSSVDMIKYLVIETSAES